MSPQSIEMNQLSGQSLKEEITEIREASRAHATTISEGMERLKRNTSTLTTTVEGAIQRESMERENLQKAIDLLKKEMAENAKNLESPSYPLGPPDEKLETPWKSFGADVCPECR